MLWFYKSNTMILFRRVPEERCAIYRLAYECFPIPEVCEVSC